MREQEGTKTDFVTDILLSDIKPTEFCFTKALFFSFFVAISVILHFDPSIIESNLCHFIITVEVCSEATNIKEKLEK